MNVQQVNVLLLGLAFFLIFFSFQTSVFIQQTVVNSIKSKPNSTFTGNGYISLCLTYIVCAISNWLAPSIVAWTGVKYAMIFSSLTYVTYSACFIYPTTFLFYASAAVLGLGAGPLWSAQGSYLTLNSDSNTSSRNAGIFWAMLQCSVLFGNMFVYFAFNNQVEIGDQTRYLIYGVLTVVCALGTLVLLFLPSNCSSFEINAFTTISSATTTTTTSAWSHFKGALKLASSLNMLLLSLAFVFMGALLTFAMGVLGTSIGATSQFGLDAKKFIGLSGIFIGIGEIIGGSIFGLLGTRVSGRLGRDTVFILGLVITLISFALAYVDLPPDSPLVGRALLKPIIEPKLWLVMLSSALIGLGDACFNTQCYALLMSVYSDNSVAAFANFKFLHSVGSAIAFLYSTELNLYHQLWLLTLVGIISTICFCWVEWRVRRTSCCSTTNELEKSESRQNIVKCEQTINTYQRNGYGTTATTNDMIDTNKLSYATTLNGIGSAKT